MKKYIVLVALMCVTTQSVSIGAWFGSSKKAKVPGAEADDAKGNKSGEPRLSPGYVLNVTVVVAGDNDLVLGIRCRFGWLFTLEHDVVRQCLFDLVAEFEYRQLQQSYSLLQLRRHGQLLTKFQIQ